MISSARQQGWVLLLSVFALALPLGAEEPPVEAWVALWDGPASLSEYPASVVMDAAGWVFVAGTTYAPGFSENIFLARYAPDGTLAWVRERATPGPDLPGDLVATADGGVLLVSVSTSSPRVIHTARYDGDGTLLWEASREYSGDSVTDRRPSLALGADGSATVIHTDLNRVLVLRYSAAGDLVWEALHPAVGVDGDLSGDVAVDAAGNAYVVCQAWGFEGDQTAVFTFTVDPLGNIGWLQVETGNFGSFFEFMGIELGPDGQPVVAANPESVCGLFEMRIWKLDAATGAQLWWNRLLDADPCDVYEPVDLELDSAGNALVASFGRQEGSTAHIQTSKWSPAGDLLWYREFDGSGTSSDLAAALAIGPDDAVYVTGHTTHPPQNRDFATVKYSPAGEQLWAMEWGSEFDANDFAFDVAVGPGGEVAVVGTAWFGPGTGQDAVTILYRQDGVTAASPPPPGVQLFPSYPNPFNPTTTIEFVLPEAQPARLTVHAVDGRLVATLVDAVVPAGAQRARWAGLDTHGRRVPSGQYLYRLETPRGNLTGRMTLVK